MSYKKSKRILDVLISGTAIIFLLPIGLIIALLIYAEDHNNPFYNALRIGKDGNLFYMLKFRSMKEGAADLRNPDGTTYNSKNDPRVTRIGKILRSTSLDEIPQFINILRGEMSLVGPRPELPDSMDIYSETDKIKLTVLPGITGYAQVKYRNSATLREKFEADVFYAKNYSFFMDSNIIFKTILQVLSQKNIYRNT